MGMKDTDCFYRQATRDHNRKKSSAAMASSYSCFDQKTGRRYKLDPALRAIISDNCHSSIKPVSYEDKIERMFKKAQRNAIRQRNNFKHIEYDLDQKVMDFMRQRRERLKERALQQMIEKTGVSDVQKDPYALSDPEKERHR